MKRFSVVCIVLFGFMIFFRSQSPGANAQTTVPGTGAELRDFVVAGVMANYGKIISGQGHFRETIYADPVLNGSPGEPTKDQIHEFDLSFSGAKFIEKAWLVAGDQKTASTEAFYDGTTAGYWMPGESRGFVEDSPGTGHAKSFMAWRLGLPNTFDKNAVSLGEEIRGASISAVTRESLDGLDCYKIVGTIDSKTRKWWVSPSYGFAVVRTEFQGEPDTSVAVSAVFVIENSNFHEYPGGIWLPSRQVFEGESVRTDGSINRMKRSMLEVLSLQVNQPLDDTKFHPIFPEGVDIR